jgi:uncharacterized membrane protein
MTDTAPQTRTATWVKVVLALSLGLNLAILGLAAGAAMKKHAREPGGVTREMTFGPLSEAFSREDRRALRKAFQERAPDGRQASQKVRAEFNDLLAALRATTVDPTALAAALTAIHKRHADRLALGRDLIYDRLMAMDATERQAFAKRLEDALSRRSRRQP